MANSRHVTEPLGGQKDVVDVIGGAIFPAVPPVESRHGFRALQFTSKGVVGTGEAYACKRLGSAHSQMTAISGCRRSIASNLRCNAMLQFHVAKRMP